MHEKTFKNSVMQCVIKYYIIEHRVMRVQKKTAVMRLGGSSGKGRT